MGQEEAEVTPAGIGTRTGKYHNKQMRWIRDIN